MWDKELEISKKCAVEAGKAIMEVYRDEKGFEITKKEDSSPLTAADMASNAIITKALRTAFPDYAILSEEEKDNKQRLNKDLCFVVDPLDGTKEFIKRNGQFTVNIALSYKHRTVMGVIYVPATGEMYYAAKGLGAYRTADGITEKIAVSDRKEDIRLVASSSHGSDRLEELIERYDIKNIVKIGSSLKGCLVAKGDAEVYFRYNPTMEWDTAAMQCIVEEAGGVFRQMDDSEMLYNRENSLNDKGFYACNQRVLQLPLFINRQGNSI
ncbi:MAG: 3'(2'),5'-bisphosphate nucleotidase CysQ [Lachnospiraceae bacterium]|nr:3'(2'),5'-bisphosphate nucleotidase CysQ [Lachnospiraceae bacterium]